MKNEIYNDDEEIRIFNSEGDELADIELEGGTTEAKIYNNQEAPLKRSPFNVLLVLEGVGADDGRLGVDLVTVLDTSGTMNHDARLLKMQLAMQFLVQKLSPIDRLSVVTFNRHAVPVCRLRQITETSKLEITELVNELEAKATTNIEAGLRLALKILKDRTHTKRRREAIMLMSDGVEDVQFSNAKSVNVSEVPVYTFAFGSDCEDAEVLKAIAKKSEGGTFTPVPELDDLSVAFSTSLAGLLNVTIEDLTLTVAPLNKSELDKVNAGKYPQKELNRTVMEPVTVSFSSLYNRETRKVLANLTLPEVDIRFGVQIFKVEFKYRVNGKKEFDSDERFINVTRTATPEDGGAERPEVLAELARLKTATLISDAIILAETKTLVEAKQKLIDEGKSLTEINAILKAQVDHLILLMASQETYDGKGKAFALALKASHETQRSVALPDGIETGYETPMMKEYQKQAALFNKDKTYVPPTEEEDKKATAPPTIEVDDTTRDLSRRLAEKLKQLDSKEITLSVKLTTILEISDLAQRFAGKTKQLESQAPTSSN